MCLLERGEQRYIKAIIILHANYANVHKVKATVTCVLKQQSIQGSAHPLYSPDLAPGNCGCPVSPNKTWLGGNLLLNLRPRKPVSSKFRALSPSSYQNGLESWRRRLELRVRNGRDYLEGTYKCHVEGKSDSHFRFYRPAGLGFNNYIGLDLYIF